MKSKSAIIKSRAWVRAHGEVYTPQRLVCAILDNIPEAACQIGSTYLEPACGNGNFLAEILRRKLDRCVTEQDCIVALSSIYGIDILPDNVAEARQRLLEIFETRCGRTEEAAKILDWNIVCGDFLRPETIWFLRGEA